MSAKFAFIDAEKAQYSIVKMCTWMGVSTSGFYEWYELWMHRSAGLTTGVDQP